MIDRSRSLRQVAQQSDLLVNSVGDGIYGVDQRRPDHLRQSRRRAGRSAIAPQELIGEDAHQMFHADRAGRLATTRPSGATSPRRSATG